VSFVGLPGLNGELTGALYVASARAVTGPTATAPMSVIASVQTNNTSQPVDMSGFVGVPVLTTPAGNAAWDGTHLAATFPTANLPPDLTIFDIAAGNGLIHWLIAAPGGSQAITVPSLSGLPFPQGGLPAGPLDIAVYGAKIDNFDYQKLLYRQLRPQGMHAYSLDYFNAHL
jgi:hypothetical protein